MTLRSCGLAVLEAGNAQEAISLCEQHEGPIPVSDLLLPKITGKELANTLVAKRPAMKVLYLSGWPEADRVQGG